MFIYLVVNNLQEYMGSLTNQIATEKEAWIIGGSASIGIPEGTENLETNATIYAYIYPGEYH